MKKSVSLSILISIAALFVSGNLFAQGKWGADSAECIKYMSYYKEYYKQKAYDEATPNWRKAYSLCPATASQNMLIDGAVLMRRLISKNASDAEKLYTGYEGIIERNAEQTKSQILLYDLQAAIDQYQGGSLDAETVINIFQRNSDLLEKAPSNNEIEKEQNQKVKQDMGNVFAASKVASCDHLIELYGPRIEADPENLKLAQTIVKTMSMTDDCNSNDIYLKAVTTMYKLEPSANSAYYLFKLHSARGNVDEAIKYMEEAIASDDSDSYTDADWNYELATYYFKNGMNSKACECANTVAASSEKLAGKAYFLIGTIWGATRCGGDEIAARAPFWVACDYMIKAKNADETLTEAANQYISQYSTYFPKSEEAFMYDITNGQSYTVVCGGMRANTTVRTNK